ncbi:MAG: hypothetical protein ACXVPQ_09985, partial [Bacteroidia bacterium]
MSKVSQLLKKEKILALLKDAETKGDAKISGMEALLTTGLAVAGAQLGKHLGRPSLLYGFAGVLGGHYLGSGRLTCLGASVMAGGALASPTVNGLGNTFTDKVKAGFTNIKEDLKHRLYFDKFVKPKTTTTNSSTTNSNGTNGLGDVQYFNPGATDGVGSAETPELNMGALNAIEEEIMRGAQMHKHQMKG